MRVWQKCSSSSHLRVGFLQFYSSFFCFVLNIHIFIMLCLLSSSLHSSLYASFLFPSPRWAAWRGCALASATSSSACSSRSRWTTCARTSWPSVEPAMKWGRAARLAAYWSWCCCWGIIWTPALETPSRSALIWALSARWIFYSNLGINHHYEKKQLLFCQWPWFNIKAMSVRVFYTHTHVIAAGMFSARMTWLKHIRSQFAIGTN